MDILESNASRLKFEANIGELVSVIGHADRTIGLHDYCTGLPLSGERRAGVEGLGHPVPFIPHAGSPHDVDHRQHDRHFHQNADDGRQCGTRLESEQGDGRRHGEFEKIARADQGRRAGDALLDNQPAVQPIGQSGIEIDLNDDRHRQHADDQRLAEYLFTLQAEQQYQGQQQRGQRQRGQAMQCPLQPTSVQ